MTQANFSELIESFLIKNLPEFTTTLKYGNDGSFDCDLRNHTDEFSIWIATYGIEITIGLETPDGDTGIHTHIPCYEDIADTLICLKDEIDNITSGKTKLYRSDKVGYNWTNDIQKILKEKSQQENVKVYNWSSN